MHVVEASLWKSTIRDGLCVHIVMGGASCISSFANLMEDSCGSSRQRRQADYKFFLRIRHLIKLETLSLGNIQNGGERPAQNFKGRLINWKLTCVWFLIFFLRLICADLLGFILG
jgi:hypothetical protein